MLRSPIRPALGAAFLATSLAALGAAARCSSTSPFVTFLPSGTAGPMTGLALTFSRWTARSRRRSHHQRAAVSSVNAGGTAMRPWGADADAITTSRATRIAIAPFTPYVFAGVSTGAVDSGSSRINRQGWSYGGGMTLPLGSALGLFGEWRWRMSRYVMPNSHDAPPTLGEVRRSAPRSTSAAEA